MSSMLLNALDQTTCVRLTQTLLHFLWQGLVIGLSAGALALVFRTATARVRYGIHAVSLALMALCVPITFTWADAADLSAVAPVANPSGSAQASSAVAGTSILSRSSHGNCAPD